MIDERQQGVVRREARVMIEYNVGCIVNVVNERVVLRLAVGALSGFALALLVQGTSLADAAEVATGGRIMVLRLGAIAAVFAMMEHHDLVHQRAHLQRPLTRHGSERANQPTARNVVDLDVSVVLSENVHDSLLRRQNHSDSSIQLHNLSLAVLNLNSRVVAESEAAESGARVRDEARRVLKRALANSDLLVGPVPVNDRLQQLHVVRRRFLSFQPTRAHAAAPLMIEHLFGVPQPVAEEPKIADFAIHWLPVSSQLLNQREQHVLAPRTIVRQRAQLATQAPRFALVVEEDPTTRQEAQHVLQFLLHEHCEIELLLVVTSSLVLEAYTKVNQQG